MKRVLCIRFPDWSLQRVRVAQPEHKRRPLILFADRGRDGLRVTACSSEATRCGVLPGLRLAEAEGLCSVLRASRRPRFVRHDLAQDQAGLEDLAGWCQEFSPIVGLEGRDSLLLDVTGCTHLFGGELGLVQRVQRGVTQRGLRAVLALADTIGAAWALAHYAPRTDSCIVPPAQQAQHLGSLPVAALRLSEVVQEKLRALGLARIEQLLALPRSSLPSRLGPEVLQRLDQALGAAPESIVPVRPVSPVTAATELPAPTTDREALEYVLRRLIDQIVTRLGERCEGVQQLEVQLDCGPKGSSTLLAGTVRPSTCQKHLAELLLAHLEQIVLPGEVQAVRLTVRHSGPLDVRQRHLFERDNEETRQRELARLVDRLSSRLGKERVVRPRIYPDILPEFAVRWQPLLDCGAETSSLAPETRVATRPLCLWRHPQPITVVSVVPNGPPMQFDHEGRTHTIAHAWGPERLAAGWWRGAHAQRDYYRVETKQGQRFWLFRIREGDWYLHGEFD